MGTPGDLLQQLRYETWANRRLLEAIAKSPRNVEPLRVFAHILGAQETWLARLTALDTPAAEVWPSLSVKACRAKLEEVAAGLEAFLQSSGETQLTVPVAYRSTNGTSYENTPLEILTHLFLHSHYHRGQVAARLRDAGIAPPNTDYIAWLREAVY